MAELPSEQKNVEPGMSNVEVKRGSFFLRSFLFAILRFGGSPESATQPHLGSAERYFRGSGSSALVRRSRISA
jgi:hypothetical protein